MKPKTIEQWRVAAKKLIESELASAQVYEEVGLIRHAQAIRAAAGFFGWLLELASEVEDENNKTQSP